MAEAAAKERDATAPYERASPTLLAQQPAQSKSDREQQASAEWQELRAHLEARVVSLRAWRASWWIQNWSDLAEFILPRRSIWLTQSAGGIPTPNNMSRGRPINQAIVDPTATLALRIASGGLVSGLASPSRPWFKVIPAMRRTVIDAAGREWLDSIEDRMYTVAAGSNFYNSFAQEIEDNLVFGTAPSIMYEDERDLIRLYNPAVGEYYLSSGATMRVDGLYRQFVMTVAQIVDFFEIENCPAEVQKQWAQKGNQLQVEYIIGHSIEPNFGIGENDVGRVPGKFTWREVYWLYGLAAPKPLSMRGFVDQPFTASRWSTQSNDAYGRSVGMDVLPDVMQLQVMTRRLAEAIEKQVRPPLVADMSLKNQPSSSLPGHVTYVQSLGPQSGMRPMYEVNPDVAAMTVNIQAIQARIKVAFFNDLFLMLEQRANDKMTAFEVAQKVQEKMQVVGPVIESLLDESLKPKLKRMFAIMSRKGMFDDPPRSMKGMPLDIQFVSQLALAQKAAAMGGIQQLIALVGAVEPFFPTAKDNIDSDSLIREANELLGNPEKILRGPEDVARLRQSNAQMLDQQRKMGLVSQMAEAAGKAAPAGQLLAGLAQGQPQGAGA